MPQPLKQPVGVDITAAHCHARTCYLLPKTHHLGLQCARVSLSCPSHTPHTLACWPVLLASAAVSAAAMSHPHPHPHPAHTHLWQQVPDELLVHQCVVGAHTDAQAGYVGDGAKQAARDAAGEQPVHVAGVALRAAVLLPPSQVKHLQEWVLRWG